MLCHEVIEQAQWALVQEAGAVRDTAAVMMLQGSQILPLALEWAGGAAGEVGLVGSIVSMHQDRQFGVIPATRRPRKKRLCRLSRPMQTG